MDVVASLLEGPQARDAFIIRTHMSSPWALQVEDDPALLVIVVLHGKGRLTHPGLLEAVVLEPGDLALIQGGKQFVFGDVEGSSPQMRVLKGNHPATMDGRQIGPSMNLGVRTWGTPEVDDLGTRFLTGIYEDVGEASRRLLAALAPVVLRRGATEESVYAGLLATEALTEAPGQSAVLDRLLDLVLIDTVRHHFTTEPDAAPGWYSALSDEVAGDALRAIHENPAAPWSVTSLAADVGVSRATFSRRFTVAVGESPMAYVKRWRLTLAADRLADPQLTVAKVAELVGYQSPFTFSSAFKAHFGQSPSHYRESD